MRIEDMATWTVDQLKEELVRLADERESKQHEILEKNEKINELQTELDKMCDYSNDLKRQLNKNADMPFYDESAEIAKYRRQHQDDCITINQLGTALDVIIDRYANLRKTHGVS